MRAELLPLKAYTVADGLAHNVINKIVRDSRGFLLSKQILPLSQRIDLRTLTPDPLPAIFQSTNTLAAGVYSLQPIQLHSDRELENSRHENSNQPRRLRELSFENG